MSASGDIELGELVIVLGITGAIIYFLHKWLSSSTCLLKAGAIPGITGASQSQVDAAKTAADNLKPGGKVIASNGSDFCYQQPDGTITQVRHNPLNYIWPWSDPLTYKCVPLGSACVVCNCGLFQ